MIQESIIFIQESRIKIQEKIQYRAIAFVKKLHGQMEKLAASPSMGRSRDQLLSGLRSFPYGNYLIFYIPLDDGVDIVRVLNGVRNIEALFQDDEL